MAQGDQQVLRQRKPVTREEVGKRTKRRLDALPPEILPEGVQSLNPGYFLLERMRLNHGAKSRAGKDRTLRSK